MYTIWSNKSPGLNQCIKKYVINCFKNIKHEKSNAIIQLHINEFIHPLPTIF